MVHSKLHRVARTFCFMKMHFLGGVLTIAKSMSVAYDRCVYVSLTSSSAVFLRPFNESDSILVSVTSIEVKNHMSYE